MVTIKLQGCQEFEVAREAFVPRELQPKDILQSPNTRLLLPLTSRSCLVFWAFPFHVRFSIVFDL